MKQYTLSRLWAMLFILCAGLGFIPERTGALDAVLTLLSVAFFVPPALLLRQALRRGAAAEIRLIRNLSALSLGLTLALMVLSIVFAAGSDGLGLFLHVVLVIVSAPMFCAGRWALSLFLWACLMVAAMKSGKK